jgi:hypothetical protein
LRAVTKGRHAIVGFGNSFSLRTIHLYTLRPM